MTYLLKKFYSKKFEEDITLPRHVICLIDLRAGTLDDCGYIDSFMCIKTLIVAEYRIYVYLP